MRLREKVELSLLPAAAAGAFAAAPLLPAALHAGSLALVCASLLLGQGLIRDLWLKYGARDADAPGASCSRASFCAESGLGLLGIAAGAALLASGLGGLVGLSALRWAALVLSVGLVGFLCKDVVLDLRARRLRIEKDHRNVVLW